MNWFSRAPKRSGIAGLLLRAESSDVDKFAWLMRFLATAQARMVVSAARSGDVSVELTVGSREASNLVTVVGRGNSLERAGAQAVVNLSLLNF